MALAEKVVVGVGLAVDVCVAPAERVVDGVVVGVGLVEVVDVCVAPAERVVDEVAVGVGLVDGVASTEKVVDGVGVGLLEAEGVGLVEGVKSHWVSATPRYAATAVEGNDATIASRPVFPSMRTSCLADRTHDSSRPGRICTIGATTVWKMR